MLNRDVTKADAHQNGLNAVYDFKVKLTLFDRALEEE